MSANNMSKPGHQFQPSNIRVLSDSEVRVLAAIALYSVVTAEQICRLFFSTGSLRYVQDMLKRLSEVDGLLLRSFVPKPTLGGRARYTWRLSNAGRRVLHAQDGTVRPRFRPSEQPDSRPFLEHTLACTDVFIAAALLCRARPQLSVEVRPEWMLKTKPVRVPDGDKQVAVIPDGYLEFRNDREQRLCLAYEWDTGSENRAKQNLRWRHLIAFARGPYRAYGAQLITIAMLTPSAHRAEQVLSWIETVLREEQAEDLADGFRIAAGSPSGTPPETLFLSPIWTVPLYRQQVALLEGLL